MDRMLKMCMNWKVIGGLALVGVGVWAVAPHLLIGAFPLLLIAVCPLSMLLMMKGISGDQKPGPAGERADGKTVRDT